MSVRSSQKRPQCLSGTVAIRPDLLPELGDGAGQVGGVSQAVVREAFWSVPRVVAGLPRQLLHSQSCLRSIKVDKHRTNREFA